LFGSAVSFYQPLRTLDHSPRHSLAGEIIRLSPAHGLDHCPVALAASVEDAGALGSGQPRARSARESVEGAIAAAILRARPYGGVFDIKSLLRRRHQQAPLADARQSPARAAASQAKQAKAKILDPGLVEVDAAGTRQLGDRDKTLHKPAPKPPPSREGRLENPISSDR